MRSARVGVNFRLMDINLADLPDNVETLQRMVRTLAAERANLTEAQAEIERLRLIVQKLQRSQFGRRAELLDDEQLQLSFEYLNADIARVEATLPSEKVKTPASRSRYLEDWMSTSSLLLKNASKISGVRC